MTPPRHSGLRRASRTALGGLVASLVVLAGREAAAQPDADGAYGRLEGDLALAVELGVREAFPGEAACARVSSLYLYTVGLAVAYDESFGRADQPTERSLAFGVELRPLLLPRFAGDLEQGPATLDLWLDSLSLGLAVYGAMLPEQGCRDGDEECWSWGLEVSSGMELALLSRGDGPFVGLRGAVRWPGRPDGEVGGVAGHPWGVLSLSLGYRGLLTAHLVDLGDEAL